MQLKEYIELDGHRYYSRPLGAADYDACAICGLTAVSFATAGRDDMRKVSAKLAMLRNSPVNKSWLNGAGADFQRAFIFEKEGVDWPMFSGLREATNSAITDTDFETVSDQPHRGPNTPASGSNGDVDLASVIFGAIKDRIPKNAVDKFQVGEIVEERLETAVEEMTLQTAERLDSMRADMADLQVKHAKHVEERLAQMADDLSRTAGTASRTFRIEIGDERTLVAEGLRHAAFDDILADVAAFQALRETAKANWWMVGPAGTGKTTAAKKMAELLNLPFYFNGAIDSEYKLRGFIDAQGRVVYTPFRNAYTNGGVYLFDEVDSSLPQACLAFNAALANGEYDFPGEDLPVQRHPDCLVFAASNTWGGPEGGYVGRFRQDAAFMDRFMRVPWETDERLERALCKNDTWCDYVQRLRAATIRHGIEHIISPRATFNGAIMIAAGRPWSRAVEVCVRKGLNEADWSKIIG